MTDWIAALGDVPQAAIEQAVAERLRLPDRARPTPGEIRHRALARLAPKPPPSDDDDEWPFGEVVPEVELEHRRKMQDAIRADFPMLRRMAKLEGDEC